MIYKNTELHNCYDIVSDAYSGEMKMIRVPERVREAMSPIGRQYTAYNTPNTEIRFCMNRDEAEITLQIFHPKGNSYGNQALKVYFGCFQEDGLRIITDEECKLVIHRPENMELLKQITRKHQLPFDPEVVRIIAPGDCHLMLAEVAGDVRPPGKEELPNLRWLAYGSSITQGCYGLHPQGAYAAVAARKLKADLLNLGFGGSALLEPEMADFIAERHDFDFLTMEMGINMVWDIEHQCIGDADFFRKRVDYFVSRIADAHPDKWIFCLDIFPNKDDYTGEGQSDCYRQIVKEKVTGMKRERLVWLDGRKYLNIPDGLCVDLLHPSAQGCMEIGERLADDLRNILTEVKYD